MLGDVWGPEERGRSVALYTLLLLLGPTLGPILGGFVAEYSSWSWIFWSVSIVAGVIEIVATFLFRETFAPVLLGRKCARLREETNNANLHTKWDRPERTFGRMLLVSIARPFALLGTQPILQILVLYIAYLFGLTYLVETTFPKIWTQGYDQSISVSSLHYLALALGYILGTQSCSNLVDRVYRRLKFSWGKGIGQPEYRLPLLIPGSLAVPVGILWYGWSAQHHLHWIMPDIGIGIFAFGMKYGMQCTQLYGLDVYPTFAASASASGMFVRSLAGFAFPLFAPDLYQRFDVGWGNSLLALFAFVIGVPAPFLLWFYGPALRRRSTLYAGE